jgi:tetratricopeptide (TPR) repeat protein
MHRTIMLQTRARFSIVVMAIAATALPVAGLPVQAAPRKGKPAETSGISGEARELRDKGIVELNLGRYDEAVKLLEQAYELSRDPAILFDLVQAHRLYGNPDRALVLCASFLRTAPALTPRNREQIERTVSELNIIVEQIHMQGKDGRRAVAPSPKVAVKEKPAAVEPPPAAETEPPAVVAVEPPAEKDKDSESKAVATGPLPSSAAKEAGSAGADRSAELLKAESTPVEAQPGRPFYRSPWLWTAVGLVVSGVAAWVVYESTKDPGPPRTSWGAVSVF